MGDTIGWYLCMIIDQNGRVMLNEKWEAPYVPEPEPEENSEQE